VGQQRHVERLGQGDVQRVVEGQVVAQLPTARPQVGVPVAEKLKLAQVGEGLDGPLGRQLAAVHLLAKHVPHLGVEEVRGGHPALGELRGRPTLADQHVDHDRRVSHCMHFAFTA
jgi:hypothetical protein